MARVQRVPIKANSRNGATHASIITESEKMRAILDRLETVAASDSSILLIGETGVGKELFAEHIHRNSLRCDRRLVKISLSAVPADLLESELFGHLRGAFTGAFQQRAGLFELAHKGTIFLDDIDDVPPCLQVKLLRALESQEIMQVGASTTIPVDVRLITASKVDLKSLVDQGTFRPDFYYRINVVPIEIPPLRERIEDIPILMRHFRSLLAPKNSFALSSKARRVLENYPWPGNIRELRNITQRLNLLNKRTIDLEDLPAEVLVGDSSDLQVKHFYRQIIDKSLSYRELMNHVETNLLRLALQESQGNQTQAARILGLSLSTLRDKLKTHRLY